MARQMENPIHHFRHPHPLRLTKFNQDGRGCYMCQRRLDLDATVYSCERCSFFLHRACAKFQQQIMHPFHPHHTLVYLDDSPYGNETYCSVCREKIKHGIYHCEGSDCRFNLDLGCAALTPSKKYVDHVAMLQEMHQHPLILCDKPNDFYDFYYFCSRCSELIVEDNLIYACLECNNLLDESCAAHGREIRHPFHPDHALILQSLSSGSSPECSVCANLGYLFVYQCSLCDFSLDLDCAKLKPTTKKIGPDEELSRIETANHPHPLIQCDTNRILNYQARCYGCGLRFLDFAYPCLKCAVLFHRSCADLPREISHPFHPQHPLILVENHSKSSPERFSCPVCGITTGMFFYKCGECDFGLDIKCSLVKHPPIMTEVHHHHLAYIDLELEFMKLECAICDSSCSKYYFRCLECNFSIHDHCYPSLPKNIKHDCHIHPLMYTTTRIKDMPDEDDFAEFYCNACETRRVLDHPTYYCAGCHFVAHIHCVISEILPCLKREHLDLSTAIVKNIKLDSSETTEEDTDGSENEATSSTSSSEGASSAVAIEEVSDEDVNCAIRKLDEQIAEVRNKLKALAAELEQLERRRAQLIVQDTQDPEEE